MLDIEKAKKQASLLTEYLRTVGKNLKRTHALEAVARMNGHKSWNVFQQEPEMGSTAKPDNIAQPISSDLATLFLSGDVSWVVCDGERYSVRYYDSEALGKIGRPFDEYEEFVDDLHICVELERNEDGLIFDLGLSQHDIEKATPNYADSAWTLPDGSDLKLFTSVALFNLN